MNGTLTATYPGVITRSVTSFSLKNATQVEWTKGDEVDVLEDHYGNTYVVVAGVEESCFHVERNGEITFHSDGLRAKVAECDRILAIHAGPDGNPKVRDAQTLIRQGALNALANLEAV